jgi:hypothetical protein
MRLASFVAVIQAEKDPVQQRKYNRQFLGYLFDSTLLMSGNIVVAQKISTDENSSPA